MNWPAFWKWVVFALLWCAVLDRWLHQWPWLVVSLGALAGYVTLVLWDAWRGRNDHRELAQRERRRFETGESEPDGPIS